jgi:MOSC domain-containing protein YiiM
MTVATQVGVLQSVQVGSPQRYGTKGAANRLDRAWETSFFRVPSAEPRWLHTTHLAGNEQADKQNHGRPSQAVLCYGAETYARWREELGRADFGPGGFGENFTIAGLSEATACIGDTYAIGEAQIRITGPRYPCWKIERRWRMPGLTARVAATGRTGWYCCVLREGLIEPGSPVLLAERPYPRWTVALVNAFGHGRNGDLALARELAACPLLNEFWQELVVRQALAHQQGKVA